MITITIDGHEVQVAEGTNVVEAARRVDVEIPTYCYHPGLTVVGHLFGSSFDHFHPVACHRSRVIDHNGDVQGQVGGRLLFICSNDIHQGIDHLGFIQTQQRRLTVFDIVVDMGDDLARITTFVVTIFSGWV